MDLRLREEILLWLLNRKEFWRKLRGGAYYHCAVVKNNRIVRLFWMPSEYWPTTRYEFRQMAKKGIHKMAFVRYSKFKEVSREEFYSEDVLQEAMNNKIYFSI